MLVDRIAEKQNLNRSKGWKSYLDHCRDMVQGKEPNVDKLLSCLESVGKKPEDFDKDVETMRKRVAAFDALSRRDEYRLTGPKLFADYQALKQAKKEVERDFDERIKQAFFASNASADGLRQAEKAEKFLRDSCLDLSLHARKKEIQSRWDTCHQRLMKSNDELRSKSSTISSAKSERERLVRTHAHPDTITSFDSQLPYQQKILDDLQERFDSVRAELTAIDEELESVHSAMMQP